MMHRESNRLEFRPLNLEQLENIYRQFSDGDMCRYFSDPPCSVDEAKEIIEHYSHADSNSYFRVSMFDKSSGAFVGTIGYHYLDLKKKQVEIGYDVWKSFWGKGYASEAMEMLLEDCFNELDIDLIYALVHPENTASIRLLKKYHFHECEPCRHFEEHPQICLKLYKEERKVKSVLKQIAHEFERNEIVWGVGGSLLLKKYSLVELTNDIDIVISANDIDRAVEVLDRLGNRVKPQIKEEYETEYFFQYNVNGISIDVIARFKIKHLLGRYEMIFDEKSVTDFDIVDGVRIPYASLEDWLIAYMLMINRDYKVNLIWNYFITKGIYHSDLIERAMKQPLPAQVEEKLNELLLYTYSKLKRLDTP